MTQTTTTTETELDSPWKEMLDNYFEEFIEFFFPNVYDEVDWTKGYQFLDTEFQQVVRDAEIGRRWADKLARVWKKTGEPAILYIHVEVQGQYEKLFNKRMFTYHYRIVDRYDQPVLSLAIVGDDRPDWYPGHYSYAFAGCELSFRFPIVKLLDYRKKWAKLGRSRNPFAIVVRTHLKGLETRHSPTQRLRWKINLVKALYKANYSRQDILELFRFIDWVLALPPELEEKFDEVITVYEEEHKMPYITSIERKGIQKGISQGVETGMAQGLEKGVAQGLEKGIQRGIQRGLLQKSQEAVLDILQVRFQKVPKTLVKEIQAIEDTSRLSSLLKQAVVVDSLATFKKLVAKNR